MNINSENSDKKEITSPKSRSNLQIIFYGLLVLLIGGILLGASPRLSSVILRIPHLR